MRNVVGQLESGNLGKMVSLGGLLASLAAVVGLLVTGWQIRHDLKEKRIQQWEEVAVYTVCVESGFKGATLDEVKAKYHDAAKDLPDDLPREALQTETIKRSLISLIEKQAVYLRPDGTYAARRDQLVPEIEFERPLYDRINKAVVQLVRDKPHVLTRQQIREQVLNELPDSTSQKVENVLNGISLGPNRTVMFDPNNKAFLTDSAQK